MHAPVNNHRFRTWLRQTSVDLFYVDVRSLRLFRVCLGAALILTYLNYLPYVGRLLSDEGVYTRTHALLGTSKEQISLYLANGTTFFAILLLLLSIGCAVAIIAQRHTRAAIFASYVLFQSLAVRNSEMVFGLHTAMLTLLFWAFFLPVASDQKALKSKGNPKKILSVAALGLVLNAAAILYGAGIAKFREYDFWIGNANALDQLTTYYTNQNVLTEGLRHFPGLMRFLSRLTVAMELGVVAFLFLPVRTRMLRTVGLFLAGLFFLSITLCIHVGVFPLLPYIALLVLLPGSVWDAWDRSALRLGISRRASSAMGAIRQRSGVARRAIQKRARAWKRVLSWAFLVAFLLVTLSNSLRTKSIFLRSIVANLGLPSLLHIVRLNNTWDWVYGGPMHTKLLIAQYVTDRGSFYENISDTPYEGLFYNYRMNYANAIMRNDWLVNRYFQVHCSHPGTVVPTDAIVRSMNLYIIEDTTKLTNPAEFGDPYSVATCPRADADTPEASDIAVLLGPEGAGLAALPILEMRQDFKNVVFDKSVEGHPISLGEAKYAQGIGTHANGRVTFYVEGATEFSVVAGLDDEVKSSPFASVILRIEGDAKELYRSPLLLSSTTPQKIQLSIAGVSRLSLIAEDAGIGKGSTLNYDDHVSWGSPRVWKVE